MKTALPVAVLLAYLLTWLSFGRDGAGPVGLFLPLIAMGNFSALTHGQPGNAEGIVAVVSGIFGLVGLLIFVGRIWRNRWGATVSCVALAVSIGALATGDDAALLTLATAIPFLILSIAFLRKGSAVLASAVPKA
jgi:hypothetical protein